VSNAFLAGDLFNLYVGFEILLMASYVLLTLGGSAPRVRAGITYVVVSLTSSLIFLAAIGLVYASTGTVNMAQLAGRLAALPPGMQLLIQSMLLIAFSIKAAVFPLSAWLPDSYPTAPAPVTAVFAGLLTKVGVYAIIRTQTLLFPDGGLDDLLMWAGLATMLIGILGAVAQTDIRRMLSFTLVSHIGYMVFGIALGTAAGLAGAIFYVAHHIAIQTTLFLVAGLIERQGGSTSVNRLGGLAKRSPLLAVLFFVPAMNLAGIPPFSGFIGKLGLLQAGVAAGSALALTVVAGGVITSLLTLLAVARVWTRAFWRPASQEPLADTAAAAARDAGDREPELQTERRAAWSAAWERHEQVATAGTAVAASRATAVRALRPLPGVMVGATAVMVAVTVSLTGVAGWLYGYTDRAAADLLDRTSYVEAVFEGPVPAEEGE
jgi:multicomponent Na+:H+ antiporter subunit D